VRVQGVHTVWGLIGSGESAGFGWIELFVLVRKWRELTADVIVVVVCAWVYISC